MLLMTGDIHLKENELDSYRWGLFKWLREQAVKYKVAEVLLLGDVTDRKEGHSAKMVNRLYLEIKSLSEVAQVIWLMGNHDFLVDRSLPFFEFMNSNRVRYIKSADVFDLSVGKATFVPAGTKWNFKLHDFPYTFTHATFSGAKAENGTTMTGVDPSVLNGYKGVVYSGDIHVPQDLRQNLVYVGAPYHVRFGDNYKPRVIRLTDEGDEYDLHFPAPRKLTLSITKPDDLLKERVQVGDHVKIKCYLQRADYVLWKEYRQRIRDIATDKQWVLFSTEPVPLEITKAQAERISGEVKGYASPEELVEVYTKQHKASPEHLRIGKELL